MKILMIGAMLVALSGCTNNAETTANVFSKMVEECPVGGFVILKGHFHTWSKGLSVSCEWVKDEEAEENEN